MAAKKSKSKFKKSKCKAKAVPAVAATRPEANGGTQPTNESDDEADVKSKAYMGEILHGLAGAKTKATASATPRDVRDRASPHARDSERETSYRFPDFEELEYQIGCNQYELRKEMGLGPPRIANEHRPLWDALTENHNTMQNLRAAYDNMNHDRQALIGTLKCLCECLELYEQRDPVTWVWDPEAMKNTERLKVANRVGRIMEERYNGSRRFYLMRRRIVESTIDVSHMRAEDLAMQYDLVIPSEMEDLEDVYWEHGNKLALRHVVQKYEDTIDPYSNPIDDSQNDGSDGTVAERYEAKTPYDEGYVVQQDDEAIHHHCNPRDDKQDADSDGTVAEPDEVKTPYDEDYVVYTYPQGPSKPPAATEPEASSPSAPPDRVEIAEDVDRENLDWVRQQIEKGESFLPSKLDEVDF